MDRAAVQTWLTRYIEAWRDNAPDQIEALFTDDAIYRYRPYGNGEHAVVGRAELVESWLDEPDPPGSWDAQYDVFAVDGDRAVAVGSTHYMAQGDKAARTFHNCYLITFAADGRCAEFTEFYMEQPNPRTDG